MLKKTVNTCYQRVTISLPRKIKSAPTSSKETRGSSVQRHPSHPPNLSPVANKIQPYTDVDLSGQDYSPVSGNISKTQSSSDSKLSSLSAAKAANSDGELVNKDSSTIDFTDPDSIIESLETYPDEEEQVEVPRRAQDFINK